MTKSALDNLYHLKGKHANVTIDGEVVDCVVEDPERLHLIRDGHSIFPDPLLIGEVTERIAA